MLPDYRAAGIGSALLDGLERALETAGVGDLVLGVTAGQHGGDPAVRAARLPADVDLPVALRRPTLN